MALFHATDIYHGSGYFDRDVWPRELRNQILFDLSDIIQAMHLPVVAGTYIKNDPSTFLAKAGPITGYSMEETMQMFATCDCVLRADGWLAIYEPDERAVVIAEDTNRIKPMMKLAIRTFKSIELMVEAGLPEETRLK